MTAKSTCTQSCYIGCCSPSRAFHARFEASKVDESEWGRLMLDFFTKTTTHLVMQFAVFANGSISVVTLHDLESLFSAPCPHLKLTDKCTRYLASSAFGFSTTNACKKLVGKCRKTEAHSSRNDITHLYPIYGYKEVGPLAAAHKSCSYRTGHLFGSSNT